MMLSGLVAAAAVLGGSCTCSDRVGGQEPQGYGEPACLWLITPWDNRADRSKQVIIDHENNRSGTACLCLTEDEYDSLGERLSRVGWPEDGTLLKEFNELAYDECKRLVEVIGGLVDDECREYYEGGRWLKHTYFARSPWENSKPPGFTCIEP
ncbi:MAG: hypothetical protein AAGF11_16840 [Myxococcota bacterium]